jgi:hypothetical protein
MNFQRKKSLFHALMMCSMAIIMTTKVFSSDQETLESSKPYQWSKIYNLTDDPKARDGHQILHFSANKHRPYANNQYAQEFVDQYCSKAKHLDTDADVLRFSSDHVEIEGAILEMGTGAAKTTNFLAALNPKQTVHTFDSYKGLPEDWDKGVGSRIINKGSFCLRDPNSNYLPPVLNNVIIHVGDFEDVLPKFKKQKLKNNHPIALLNIDCDIYSSTKIVFDILGDNIVPGTIIHLDELYNYPNYKQGEWKALQEFVQRKGYTLEFLAFNAVHEQVVVKIK